MKRCDTSANSGIYPSWSAHASEQVGGIRDLEILKIQVNSVRRAATRVACAFAAGSAIGFGASVRERASDVGGDFGEAWTLVFTRRKAQWKRL